MLTLWVLAYPSSTLLQTANVPAKQLINQLCWSLLQGWFLAGCVFMIVVMVGLLKNGSDAAYRRNDQVKLRHIAGCALPHNDWLGVPVGFPEKNRSSSIAWPLLAHSVRICCQPACLQL